MARKRQTIKSVLYKYRYSILVPLIIVTAIWLTITALTENKSVAPFVYATY